MATATLTRPKPHNEWGEGIIDPTDPWAVPPLLKAGKVHDHGYDPSCLEREVDGELKGECLTPAVVDESLAEAAVKSSGLSKPKPRTERKRRAGGDDSVERDGMGRPKILVKCVECSATGRVPSEKRPGNTIKCKRCNAKGLPPGWRKVSYTRVTTFIDVLEDKEALMTWEGRMVLIGCALDTGFLKDVAGMDPEDKDAKDALNRRAEAAKDLAGANKKSNDGTFLHELSEIVDQGLPLPATHPDPDTGEDREVTDWDRDRMDSYREATAFLDIVLMEQLMVNDDLKVAGTPDRVSRVREGFRLIAPDGYEFDPNELIITDLKTGRVDFGRLKMAMQLSIYSRSWKYDKAAGKRVMVPRINQKWGLIMHTPSQGESQGTTLYWADLTLGWEAVQVAREVRGVRSKGSRALIPVESAPPNE